MKNHDPPRMSTHQTRREPGDENSDALETKQANHLTATANRNGETPCLSK
jgi:hypothetical protein